MPARLPVRGDGGKLARVFGNLLKNAVHYSHPNTTIQVTAVLENELVTVRVENTGPTIAPHHLERIFEQFFREDAARGAETGGAGLGLAIARQIVTAHGGTITARSQDGHTEFEVTLPATEM